MKIFELFRLTENLNQIFISHSRKDVKINDEFRNYFNGTRVKPFFAEFEKWSRDERHASYWIWKNIANSKALFLLLTESVAGILHTRNWVAFEIGIAFTLKKPIWVFREIGEVEPTVTFPMWAFQMKEHEEFNVPYLDHFIPYPTVLNDKGQWLSDEYEKIAEETLFENMERIIRNPTEKKKDLIVQCGDCRLEFCYHGTNHKFKCPSCSEEIELER